MSKIISVQKEVFQFEELPESAKGTAINAVNCFDDFAKDFVIDDAKTVAALMGWRIDKIYFSGFWSQGDGACFEGVMRYAKGCTKAIKSYAPQDTELQRIAQAWQDLQKRNFYSLTATVKQRGHYMHSGCTSFDCEDTRTGYLESLEIQDEIETIGRDFMDWIYKSLEKEYDYQTSESAIVELCEANDYLFDKHGNLI
jgi:hypothetical protein